MYYEQDPNRLEVYHEGQKRRLFVGLLEYVPELKRFRFTYDMNYLLSKIAIPLGPDLPMSKPKHESKTNALFLSFIDRIPLKENPAYPEYCLSQGISPDETNQIILLSTIGRRGPSTFVFEGVFRPVGTIADEVKDFRKQLELSRWDVAMAFDIPQITLARIEAGEKEASNMARLIHFFITQPKLALDQLELTGKKVHARTRTKLYRYYRAKIKRDL